MDTQQEKDLFSRPTDSTFTSKKASVVFPSETSLSICCRRLIVFVRACLVMGQLKMAKATELSAIYRHTHRTHKEMNFNFQLKNKTNLREKHLVERCICFLAR